MQMFNFEGTFKKVAGQLKRFGGGAKFFNAQGKRGESVELHRDLNSGDRDREKTALKRIIANMTLGRDVSQLFADVVKLGQTPNMEVKKLVYLYVLSNAKLQPEKALMAVNTFLQDATHASPLVRALALRTMLCLRVAAVAEHTIPPLVSALTTVGEADAYVRKTAAIGVGKVYHFSKTLFEQHGLLEHLTNLLSDPFPVVSSNAAAVLCEILTVPGHPNVTMSKAWATKLLNSLADATEWGQVYILEALTLYQPPSDEAENLVERVLPRLGHANSAVVLAAVKAIASFTHKVPAASRQPFLNRVNTALLTLAKGDPETQYVVCRNAQMLLNVFPTLLSEQFESFFIRFTDPPFVKFEKLRLLLRITTPSSAGVIMKELCEYANEVDPTFVAEVLQAAALVAIRVDSVADRAASLLQSIVQRRPDVMTSAVVATKDMLRRYPNLVLELLPPLVEQGYDTFPTEEARLAFVWMLGEFADLVEGGTPLLMELADGFASHELPTKRVLLTAVLKAFLRNPAGTEKVLMGVLDHSMRGSSNPDLRDRALLYYRLLSRGVGVDQLRKLVHNTTVPADTTKLHHDGMTPGEMLRSVNTAAAVYARPPRKFVPTYGIAEEEVAEEDDDFAVASEAEVPNDVEPTPPTTSTSTVQQHVDVNANIAAKPNPNSLDALFDTPAASPVPPSTAGSSDMPPLVVAAAANAGVAIHAAFEAAGATVSAPNQLVLGIHNASTSPVTDVQVQLNKNRFSLAPIQAVSLDSPIAAGGSRRLIVPVGFVQGHRATTTQTSGSIQAGVSVNGKVVTFTVDLPHSLFFSHSSPIAKDAFAQQWQAMNPVSEERQFGLPSPLPAAAAELASKLSAARIPEVAVAPGQAGKQRLFCSCSTYSGAPGLVEIVVPGGPVTVRSAAAEEVADSVQQVLTALGRAGGPAAASSGGKPAMTVDDLFA